MSRQTLTNALLAVSILFLVLALVTLLPHSAPTLSDLGYYTFCPFAPWSTLTLLFLGWLCWVLRRHIKSQPA